MAGEAKPGSQLERMVAAIQTMIGSSEGFRVERNRKLRHLVTGGLREFDVLASKSGWLHEFTIAFECKDLARPVSVKDVESFKTKLDGCAVDKGCIVSTNGFTKEARRLANYLKIEFVSIGNFALRATDKDALLTFTSILHGEFVCLVDFEDGLPDLPPGTFRVFDHNHIRLDGNEFLRGALHVIGNQETLPEPGPIGVVHEQANLYAITYDQKIRRINRVEIIVDVIGFRDRPTLTNLNYHTERIDRAIFKGGINVCGHPSTIYLMHSPGRLDPEPD